MVTARNIKLALPVVLSALVVALALWNFAHTRGWGGYFVFDRHYAELIALLFVGVAVGFMIETLVLLNFLRRKPDGLQLQLLAVVLLPLILFAACIVAWGNGAWTVVTK